MGRYRGKLRIISDILSVASNGTNKTQIMYQANLSYKLLSRYLTEVLNAGLICLESADSYILTRKGQEFLNRFGEYSRRHKKLEDLLNRVNNEKMVLEKMIISELDSRSKQERR